MQIWVVDDNESLLEILDEVLSADHQVITYTSGKMLTKALFDLNGSSPELLLIDWNLPGESTQHVLAEFMIAAPRCQVAVMSGDLSSMSTWPPRVHRWTKPFKLKELQLWIGSIEKTLATQSEMPTRPVDGTTG